MDKFEYNLDMQINQQPPILRRLGSEVILAGAFTVRTSRMMLLQGRLSAAICGEIAAASFDQKLGDKI